LHQAPTMGSSSTEDADEVCAKCGKSAADDVKPKICTACKMVKYCSVECQKNHWSKHKKACKERTAEIRDDNLFRQPDESYLGECPLCCIPLSLDISKSSVYTCCSQRICAGCVYANTVREFDGGLEPKCAYCREPVPKTKEQSVQYTMKRVKANDPVALRQLGQKCDREGDYEGAVEYYMKAAKMGDVIAHFLLSCSYQQGEGVEKDMKKAVYHMEEAAVRGHPNARFNLGVYEAINGKTGRAAKHFIIAAKLGYDDALEQVKVGLRRGDVSKEDYEEALHGYHAAVDATKSSQRDEAEEFDETEE
jgi:hypothetical protein